MSLHQMVFLYRWPAQLRVRSRIQRKQWHPCQEFWLLLVLCYCCSCREALLLMDTEWPTKDYMDVLALKSKWLNWKKKILRKLDFRKHGALEIYRSVLRTVTHCTGHFHHRDSIPGKVITENIRGRKSTSSWSTRLNPFMSTIIQGSILSKEGIVE